MKKSIFYKLLYVCFIALIISGAVSAFIFHTVSENNHINDLTQILETAVTATDSKDAAYLSSITGGRRITVIDMEGNVLSDSTVSGPLENHGLRPEVTAAMSGNVGISKRESATLDTEMLYIAINRNDTIYRIALTASGVDSSFLQLIPAIVIGIALASLVAILLAGGISNSLISPLMNINDNLGRISKKEYDKVNFEHSKYDEINSITGAIDGILSELSGYIEDISKQNDKMDFILNNMGQGMVLIDENSDIILCNRYADMLFKSEASPVGKGLSELVGDNKITTRAKECISDRTSRMFDMEIDGGLYAVVINFVNTTWQHKGAYILITDVTEIRSRQKLRQEFVDSVVHDLRNPIAAIGENAAQLSKDAAKGSPIQTEELEEIVAETEHMKEVIDDLLILSVLDEKKDDDGVEEKMPAIHAYDTCCNVQEKLIPMSKKMNLSMHINGNKDTLIRMKPEHFEKIMTELMTNAIKYNEEGGQVKVELEQEGKKAKISIFNTGPGLDPILIPRLFERFYREEQNRNAKIQGAGLGLAIIKHIIALYDGTISVKFVPNEGTTFKITV